MVKRNMSFVIVFLFFQWQEPKTKNHYLVSFDASSGKLLYAECLMYGSSEFVIHMDETLEVGGTLYGNPTFSSIDFDLEINGNAEDRKLGIHFNENILKKKEEEEEEEFSLGIDDRVREIFEQVASSSPQSGDTPETSQQAGSRNISHGGN